MPHKGSKKNKPTKTPSKISFSSDPLASSTPPPSQPSTHDHTSSLLQSASRQYPSLISDAAFIGRIADVTPQSNGHDATIWLSESAMLAASILPGSLVSVCLASSNKMSSTESFLDSLLDECSKISGIDVGNSMTGEVGCFFALAAVFPSCKVMKDGVRISWGLSCTMGGPSNGRVVFVSPIECQTTIDCLNWTNKLLNSTEIKIRLFKCKDLHLELVSSNIRQHVHSEISSLSDIAVVRANDQFGNGHFSSPKTPSSQSNLTLGRFDEPSPNVNYCTDTFDVSAIRIALEDKQTQELLQISSSWWLSSRTLLHGNLVTIPICGQPCLFLVREATPVLVENSGQDLVQGKENDLTLVDYVNAAFVVEPKTKVYLLSAPMESRNKVGLSLAEEESIAVSKLGGLSKEFSELKEIIFEKIHYSANYTGVLLHGPPGTGKTSLAHSCVHGAGVKLFLVNGPEIISQDYGKSEQALYKVFADASREAPAVVFIDELDAIAPARKDGGESLSHRMVATLLNLMDESKTGSLLVIAATSKPDNIDSALRRHGRFDREIEIGVPSKDQRLDILLTLLNEMEHSLLDREVQYLASTTHGFVGADLASLCNEAALTSLRRYINTKRSYNYSECDLGHMNNVDSMPSLLSNLTLSPSHFLSHGCAEKVTDRPNTFHDVIHCENTNGGGVNEELLKITLDDFERAKTKVRPSAMREVMVEVPNVSWEDIGGQEEVKKQLREAVEWPQKHQAAFEHIGIRPPTGVLLFGPPGCSKTLMARAVASNAGLNFLSVKGPELFSKWVGESEKAVRSLFSKARAAAPSIIFFDEIDGLAITRGTENDGASVGDRVMSQLLVELDGLNKRVDVTVIAATNRPDKIDPAILRPGRFDRLLYVGPPNESDREAIFRIHLRKMPCSSEVSLKELAHLTKGCTGADIFSICREAALVALEEDLNILEISMAHFKIAISSVHPSEVHSYEKFSSKFQRLVGSDGSRDGSNK